MKAFPSLLAVLLLLSSPSPAQTAQPAAAPQQTASPEQTTPAQPTLPAQPAAAPQQTASPEQTTPAQPTLPAQPAAAPQQAAPTQQTEPTQQTAAAPEPPKPESAAPAADPPSPPPPSPPDSIPSADPPAAASPATTAAAVPAVPAVSPIAFGPGAKLFLEPMNGFAELLSEAIAKKKVPVVLVHDRAQADFVMSGNAHVKTPGWIKGNFVYLHGKANISIADAHTGQPVFAYTASRVDANLVDGEVYRIWAGGCANHLKKTLKKKPVTH